MKRRSNPASQPLTIWTLHETDAYLTLTTFSKQTTRSISPSPGSSQVVCLAVTSGAFPPEAGAHRPRLRKKKSGTSAFRMREPGTPSSSEWRVGEEWTRRSDRERLGRSIFGAARLERSDGTLRTGLLAVLLGARSYVRSKGHRYYRSKFCCPVVRCLPLFGWPREASPDVEVSDFFFGIIVMYFCSSGVAVNIQLANACHFRH